jgi:hypothetical protein
LGPAQLQEGDPWQRARPARHFILKIVTAGDAAERFAPSQEFPDPAVPSEFGGIVILAHDIAEVRGLVKLHQRSPVQGKRARCVPNAPEGGSLILLLLKPLPDRELPFSAQDLVKASGGVRMA